MHYIVKKKVLCPAEKGSVIWAKLNVRSVTTVLITFMNEIKVHF